MLVSNPTTAVPLMQDCPFCGHLVVSRGGAVWYWGAKFTKILFGEDKGQSYRTSRAHNVYGYGAICETVDHSRYTLVIGHQNIYANENGVKPGDQQ